MSARIIVIIDMLLSLLFIIVVYLASLWIQQGYVALVSDNE